MSSQILLLERVKADTDFIEGIQFQYTQTVSVEAAVLEHLFRN